MAWIVTIGQGGSIRTQDRVVDVRVMEEFAHKEFVVTVQKPTQTERDQAKGRIDNAIIQIKRGSDIYVEGFIEDVELGQDIVKYSGRSFLVLLGYTTSSLTDGTSGATEAEYTGATGANIINDLINTFCVPNDAEITHTDVTFTEVYGGEVKLHGKKVYDIVRNMCIDYSKDLWADATWNGDGINIDNKNIHVGTKSRGSVVAPHKTLYGGQHLKNIPNVKYRASQNVINRIRVNGKGSGKDKVSVVVNDATSQTTYGVIEGAPYNNNMIVDETTATAVGEAIIAAKKDLVEEVHVDLIIYISDLKYGDWVRILDSYSGVDTTQRIKKITRMYNAQQGESVGIEIGMPFDNYEMLIKDLTKGDVDAEPEMTKLGGAFTITANDPPSDYCRHDKGDWYDTTGTFQAKGKGVCPFWTYTDNPTEAHPYAKALVQIHNNGTVSYKVGTLCDSAAAAEGTTVTVDALNTPIGEVILKWKEDVGADHKVESVYSSDESGKSYIYRDVRPIVGSSSTGYSGLWEVSGIYIRPLSGKPVTMEGEEITKLPKIWGPLNSDFSLHGSNAADNAWVEFIKWDHETETIVIPDKKITGLATATNASDAARFDQISEGVTAHSALTQLDYASAGHTGFAPSSHSHAWGDITGEPAYCTRWAAWSEVTSKPSLYTQAEINTWRNGTTQTEMGYMNEVSSSIQDQLLARLPLAGGAGSPMAGDLYMGGYNIKGLSDIYIHEAGAWDNLSFLSPGGGLVMKLWSAGDTNFAVNIYGELGMDGHKVTGLAAATANGDAVRYEQIPAAGLWEVSGIYAQLIAAKAIDMQTNDIINVDEIKGVTDQDIYIKPMGTGILYLG